MLKKYSFVLNPVYLVHCRDVALFLQKKGRGARQTKKDYHKVKLIKKGGGFLLCCYVPAKAVQMENVSKYWFANSETGIFVSR